MMGRLESLRSLLPRRSRLGPFRSFGPLGSLDRPWAGSPARRAATLGVAGLMAAGAVVPMARRMTGPRPARRRRARRAMVEPMSDSRPPDESQSFTLRWPTFATGAEPQPARD